MEASLGVDSLRKPAGEVDCLRMLFNRILLVGNGIADCSIFDLLGSEDEIPACNVDSSASSSGSDSQLRALATLIR